MQLEGRKRFLLIPPSLRHLYCMFSRYYLNFVLTLVVYPFLHPGGQQSQIDFEAPNFRDFPNFAEFATLKRSNNVTDQQKLPVVAALEPGDVLYLPPLWFHHVSALSPSISVSVWSPSTLTKRVHAIMEDKLPFRAKWYS